MVRQILPNNNEKCYSNFSPQLFHLNTPIRACRRWECEWSRSGWWGRQTASSIGKMRTHKTCSCVVTAGRRTWRSSDKDEIDRDTFGACSAVGSVWNWSRLCNFSLLKVCSEWELRRPQVFRVCPVPGEAEIKPMIYEPYFVLAFFLFSLRFMCISTYPTFYHDYAVDCM
jgi:hypothetical protein